MTAVYRLVVFFERGSLMVLGPLLKAPATTKSRKRAIGS